MQGKTLILGCFTSIACILFPGIKIAVCSRTIGQAQETIQKIKEFISSSKQLENELDNMSTSKNIDEVKFKNGSRIKIYPVSDNARGG